MMVEVPFSLAAFPISLTSFIGRDEALRTIATLLTSSTVRLVTITGSGGVGKTRLALAVASAYHGAFVDGVCVVPLSALHHPELVVSTIAQALGLQAATQDIMALVQAALRDKQFLLVLDNFEQVIDAAPQLTMLLAACPALKLLVTSRETLQVAGEQVFLVPPLPLPDISREQAVATLMENPAVRLFLERAQARMPAFQLTAENAQTVAEICVQVDGLPLAIELAAARIVLLPPQMLLTRLTHRLQILTTGMRDAPARQRTLRDTIRWSYDLLSPDEQQLFRRLCIFIGGATLEAIEELYQELAGDDAPADVMTGLTSLLEKSLLQSGLDEHDARVTMLETIREFGLECLEAVGELESVQQAHERYYLRWVHAACKGIFGQEQHRWIRRFVQELGNLRAIMQIVLDRSDREAALILAGQLGPIWILWGVSHQYLYLVEGKHFLEQAGIEHEGPLDWTEGRALGVYGGILGILREGERGVHICQRACTLFHQMNDLQGVIQSLWMLWYARFTRCEFREARAAAEEAIALARQHPECCTEWGPVWTQGYSLYLAGHVAVWDGRYEEATVLLLGSIPLLTQAGDALVTIWAQVLRGEAAAFAGRDTEAQALLAAVLPVCQALGMQALIAEVMSVQGILAWRAGEIEQARQLLVESLRLSNEAGDERRMAWSENWLARIALMQQQSEEAHHLLSHAIPWTLHKQDWLVVALGLEGWGAVVTTQGERHWAVRCFGAAQYVRERIGAPLFRIERPLYEERIAILREALGSAAFQIAWEQGYNLTPEQVFLAPALASTPATPLVDPVVSNPPDHAPTTETTTVALTRRERDVLRLLVEGLTNAQIAERLVLSVVTVNSYLRSLYGKLGVSSRTQAIRYAHEHHLLAGS
jgi:predicted ATPase/DNA-binding CsgD family transcriptional regulator